MKILLTEQEMINIVSTLTEQDIKMFCSGEYRKWNGQVSYDENGSRGYEFDYRYDGQGNLKKDLISTQDAPTETHKMHKVWDNKFHGIDCMDNGEEYGFEGCYMDRLDHPDPRPAHQIWLKKLHAEKLFRLFQNVEKNSKGRTTKIVEKWANSELSKFGFGKDNPKIQYLIMLLTHEYHGNDFLKNTKNEVNNPQSSPSSEKGIVFEGTTNQDRTATGDNIHQQNKELLDEDYLKEDGGVKK